MGTSVDQGKNVGSQSPGRTGAPSRPRRPIPATVWPTTLPETRHDRARGRRRATAGHGVGGAPRPGVEPEARYGRGTRPEGRYGWVRRAALR
ncbi:hypothetical protein Misp01_48850 [Microtetraspora sp. NBRC 13810]|nr:hypothetical protein Misp01_48850 [Microtetraspora sp. NBRC 13810]